MSSNDVARAKEQLKIQTLECLGTTASLVAGLGHQAALTGTALSVADVIAAIDAVSVNDVNAVSIQFQSIICWPTNLIIFFFHVGCQEG